MGFTWSSTLDGDEGKERWVEVDFGEMVAMESLMLASPSHLKGKIKRRGGGVGTHYHALAVVVCPQTLGLLQCRDGRRRVFTDQVEIDCLHRARSET